MFNQQTDAFERCYCKLRCLFQLSKTNLKDDKASGAKQTNLITKARRVISLAHTWNEVFLGHYSLRRLFASPTGFEYSLRREYSHIRQLANIRRLFTKNHDFCRFFQENSKKSRRKSRKIGNFMTKFEKIRQKLCFLANNCRIFAS